jgi:hypothetical protein
MALSKARLRSFGRCNGRPRMGPCSPAVEVENFQQPERLYVPGWMRGVFGEETSTTRSILSRPPDTHLIKHQFPK